MQNTDKLPEVLQFTFTESEAQIVLSALSAIQGHRKASVDAVMDSLDNAANASRVMQAYDGQSMNTFYSRFYAACVRSFDQARIAQSMVLHESGQ